MSMPSDNDGSGFYAFEPERFLIPPMEGFLRRIFSARWGLIIVSAPKNINLPTIMNFLANFSIQQSYYSEFSASLGNFENLEAENRELKSIEDVIAEAREVLDRAESEVTDEALPEDRTGHIPRNSDIVFTYELSPKVAPSVVEGALSGNLVAAGIRAEGSFPALRNLIDLLQSDYLVASCLMGIIGLNTVARICPYCKVRIEHVLDKDDMILVGRKEQKLYSYKGMGCDQCGGTGYAGRILVHEGFEASEKLRSNIQASTPLRQLRMLAKQEGMRTLLDAAWTLAEKSETTLDEVLRIADVTDPGRDGETVF
jgi:hypothetical protein